jgi:hypothetical protein
MDTHKGRLLGIVGFLLTMGGLAFNWYLLVHDGYFYLKLSGLGPIVAMFSLMLVAFPSMARSRPNGSEKRRIVVTLIAGVIGLALGGINFYLMDSFHP